MKNVNKVVRRETFLWIAMMLSGSFFVPAVIAGGVLGASWPQVVLAFVMYWVLLGLALGFGKVNTEVFGWTFLASIFTAWLGVPMCAFVLMLSNFPERLF